MRDMNRVISEYDAVFSFPPVVGNAAKILILGSMPGERSLAANQYYAHPRNAFWPIMGRILGFDPDAPYPDRLQAATDSGIALWDVLHSCVRPGSLDASITNGSRIVNDFARLFRKYLGIKTILLNGGEAQRSFLRFVEPSLSLDGVERIRLPSTSPAHASLTFEQKLSAWAAAIRQAREG